MKSYLAPLCLALSLLSGCQGGRYYHLEKAERLSRQGNWQEAITEYTAHIDARLKDEERGEWENPHFYHLIVGDLYLEHGEIDGAGKSYAHAAENGIDPLLISDRYRLIARTLEKDGRYEEAIEILTKHRELDPLLYDLVLDRIAKALVSKEDAAADASKGATSSHPSRK